MAFDNSVFALANKPSVQLQDPNTLLQNAANTQNAINQNRLFQGQVAAGQAMQQATDPQTGLVDMGNYNKLLAKNPLAASYAMQASQQSQNMQGQQQSLQDTRASAISSMLGSVLQLPDQQLHDGAASALDRAVTMGLVPQSQATAMAMKLPSDPTQLRSTLQQMQLSIMGPGERQQQIYGTPGSLNNGGQDVPYVQQSGMNGGVRSFSPGAATLTVSPGQAAASETIVGPDGRPITAPAGVRMPTSLQPAGMRQGGGGNGRYPTAGQGAQAAPAASQAIPGAGGAPVAGPAPGQQAMQTADGLQYRGDLNDVPNAQQRVQTLQEAKSALGQATTGKGAAPLQSLLSVINTFSPDTAKSIASATGTDVEKADLANKYLTDYARRSGAATNSDAQLAAAQGSNASTGISNQAAQDVTSLQIGRERQRIAQVQEFKADPNGIGYGKHASGFASNTDPKGFAWDTYSPQQQQAILKNTKGADLVKLQRSIGMAARLNMIQAPGQ